jgi:hypothetical protein
MAIADRELEAPLEHEIDPQLQEELLRHTGKWVAMTRTRILAVGDDPQTIFEQARASGVDAPILYHVPDVGTSYFF